MDETRETEVKEGRTEGEWLSGVAGMRALSAQVRFAYGEGGETLSVLIQTSADEGKTPVSLAHFRFGRKSDVKIANIGGERTFAPCPVEELAPDMVFDGFLGDRIRYVTVAKGEFKNSSVQISVVPR